MSATTASTCPRSEARFRWLFARQLAPERGHEPGSARGREVEHHRERGDALADRLSRLAVAGELCDELGDVRRRDRSTEGRRAPGASGRERCGAGSRVIAHVDAAVLPPRRHRHVPSAPPPAPRAPPGQGHAARRAPRRPTASARPPRSLSERAGVPSPRFAPTQPVSAQVPDGRDCGHPLSSPVRRSSYSAWEPATTTVPWRLVVRFARYGSRRRTSSSRSMVSVSCACSWDQRHRVTVVSVHPAPDAHAAMTPCHMYRYLAFRNWEHVLAAAGVAAFAIELLLDGLPKHSA